MYLIRSDSRRLAATSSTDVVSMALRPVSLSNGKNEIQYRTIEAAMTKFSVFGLMMLMWRAHSTFNVWRTVPLMVRANSVIVWVLKATVWVDIKDKELRVCKKNWFSVSLCKLSHSNGRVSLGIPKNRKG